MDEPKRHDQDREAKAGGADGRAARLADAMRANLRRRKEQQRGRATPAPAREEPVEER